jgi:hypothetical protein
MKKHKTIFNKITELKLNLLTKIFYKQLERAPAHLLTNYFGTIEPTFSKIKCNNDNR